MRSLSRLILFTGTLAQRRARGIARGSKRGRERASASGDLRSVISPPLLGQPRSPFSPTASGPPAPFESAPIRLHLSSPTSVASSYTLVVSSLPPSRLRPVVIRAARGCNWAFSSSDLISDISFSKDPIERMVFLEVEMPWNVLIPPEQLDATGLLLKKAIILRLLEDIANRKASKEHGYYVAVTSLSNIGEGKVRELTGDVLFPVTFKCIALKPTKGEILLGKVDRILKHGIFLKSGPIDKVFLSEKTMRDYRFVTGDNPMFLSDKNSNLEKDTIVRFKVLGFKWMEDDRNFMVLATLAGDYLGPI